MNGLKRGATLNDVARAAGVSLATASRVLNGSTRKVADSYRERVQLAAKELKYTANRAAQATARGESATVALLVADIADPFFGLIAQGISEGLDDAGLILNITTTGRDPERELAAVRALRGLHPCGLVLAASRDSRHDSSELYAELEEVHARGGRIVFLGGDAPFDGVRVIRPDNLNGGRKLGEAMTGLGYRKAIILASPEGMNTSDARVQGFTEAFTAGGGDNPEVRRVGFDWQAGHDGMAAALEQGVDPDTLIVGANDVVAIGAMNAIRDAGRHPGADIAVCGFDNIPPTRDMWPALTTVNLTLTTLGQRALRAIHDPRWEPEPPVPAEVLLRESTPGLR